MKKNIKNIKIIPDNKEEYLRCIKLLDINDSMKNFFIESLNTIETNVDTEMDDFYIDFPYKYNLYNYTQKFNIKEKLKCIKLGYNIKNKETNFSNYDDILLNNNNYIKLKNKKGYINYYNKIEKTFSWVKQKDDFLIVDYINDQYVENFSDEFLEDFYNSLKELYNKGLWLNNFNWYSLRYDKIKRKIKYFDPDIFYIINDNDALMNIKSFDELLIKYITYKLKEKTIIYRLKYNTIDAKVAKYIYYSYLMLEKVSKYIRIRYE